MANAMNITLTTNGMRGELVKTAAAMRELRKLSLAEGIITPENRMAYKRLAAAAASYCDSVENPDVALPLAEKLMKVCSDPAIAGYDSKQDQWWMESSVGGKQFLDALRLLTLHTLHGGVVGVEDVFHMMQTLKCRYEADAEVRKKADFIQPAYGGLAIPREYLGPLLVEMTGDSHMVPLESGSPLVLRLDWWPDSGKKSVPQVKKLLEAARKLGYVKVQFWLPPECSYDELRVQFMDGMNCKPEQRNSKGNWLATFDIDGEEAKIDPLSAALQLVEFGEKKLSEAVEGISDSVNGAVRRGKEMLSAVVGKQVGFAYQVLFSAEKDGQAMSGGIYVPSESVDGTDAWSYVSNKLSRELGKLMGDPDALGKALQQVSQKLKAIFSYANITKADGEEVTIEAAEEHPHWGDEP